MPKRADTNLRLKRNYLNWTAEAKGLSAASIDRAASAIDHYLAFLGRAHVTAFHSEKAVAFKRWLGKRRTAKGQPLSAATINGILRQVRDFMRWLADQPGCRSRIRHADAAWFSPDRKSDAARRGGTWKPHPSAEQMRHVILAMPSGTVFERRDRALMAFFFLTGCREKAATTLRLGHVDLAHACIHFDGRLVDTKFGKRFTCGFLPVGADIKAIFADWVRELREDLLRGPDDAVFPKTRIVRGPRGFAADGLAREGWSSVTPAVKLYKAAFAEVGLPAYAPHSIRSTLADLGQSLCRTPEEFKAWSQNLGHDDVMVTFRSYGSVAPGRQVELIARMRGEADDVIDDGDAP